MSQPTDALNIVLTGFMGTGKTTTGRLLAKRLGREFVDTDRLIEQRHGAISEIFRRHGETAFREMERAIARELGERRGLVISTGGRMMLDADNVAALSRAGRVFCLVATPDTILARVIHGSAPIERPLLAVPDPRGRVVELLEERATGYSRFPQVVTDGRTPEAVARELAAMVASGDASDRSGPGSNQVSPAADATGRKRQSARSQNASSAASDPS